MFLGSDEKLKGLSRKDKEKEFRKDMILSAAFEVLQKNLYSEITMSEIAARAELSKAALYLFFPNKRCLLAELLLQIFEPGVQEAARVIAEQDNWEKKLELVVSTHLFWGKEDNADFLNMLSDIFFSGTDDVPKEMVERFATLRKEVLKLVEEILEEAKVVEGVEFDTTFMAVTLIGSLESLHWFSGMGILPKDPLDYLENFKTLVTRRG